MILITASMVFFLAYKLIQYNNARYDRCSDFSFAAEFRHKYWRISNAAEGFFSTAGAVCIWFQVKHLESIIFVAILLFIVMVIALTCFIVMNVVKTLELFFGDWNGGDLMYYWQRQKEVFVEWRQSFNRYSKDIVFSSLLNLSTFILCVVATWSMASIAIPEFNR